MDLRGKNIVVYDLEIEKPIDGKEVTWSTHDKMGMSVGALFDYRTGDYSVYFREDIQELAARLNIADLVVAFNHIGFDNKLLRALGADLKPDTELKNFDMLVEGRKAIGWSENKPFPKGCKLDDFLLGTFGRDFMKTGNGEFAPIWWQEGLRGKVTTYCLSDVRREKELFEEIIKTGEAKTPGNGVHRFDLSGIKTILDPLG